MTVSRTHFKITSTASNGNIIFREKKQKNYVTLAYQPHKIKLQMHRILLNCLQMFYLIQTKDSALFSFCGRQQLRKNTKKINILHSSIYNSTVSEKKESPGSAVKKDAKISSLWFLLAFSTV